MLRLPLFPIADITHCIITDEPGKERSENPMELKKPYGRRALGYAFMHTFMYGAMNAHTCGITP